MNVKRNLLVLALMVTGASLIGIVACFGEKIHKSKRSLRIDMADALAMPNVIPLVIIGSGPAGATAAVYGARAQVDTVVFEGYKPGGLLTETTEVQNWPGHVAIQGPEIVANIKKQAEHLGAQFVDDAVAELDTSSWPFTLRTDEGNTVHALTVIIATGATPRKLGIPGENTYWGYGVTACAVCDAPFFKGEDVVVVGAGDSAAEEAMQLAPYARNVTILGRRDRMRAAASMQEQLKAYDNIAIKYHVAVQEVGGDGTKVTHVMLRDPRDNSVTKFPTAGLFLAIGHDPNVALVKDQLETNQAGYITVWGRTQETSVPGIFAAGDVEDHQYRQAGVAAGSGIKAALDAVSFLYDHGFNTNVAKQLAEKSRTVVSVEEGQAQESQAEVYTITNQQELDTLLAEQHDRLVILDFYAEYCPSCMQMLPAVSAVANEFADQVTFAKLDAEVATDVVQKLFVHKVPCLIAFRNGKLVARYTNAMSKQELREFVTELQGQN